MVVVGVVVVAPGRVRSGGSRGWSWWSWSWSWRCWALALKAATKIVNISIQYTVVVAIYNLVVIVNSSLSFYCRRRAMKAL